ncbi:MAG TPA: cytochrome c-type biogenesis protein CcmH [Gaiellaceae bacterium]|nr:cytochrome c-type biogenesis protein CcmH [Gaiellaceae bacterium]
MRLLLALVAALALAAPAFASEARPTLAELEKELVCPTCKTTLDMSDSPQADRMRAFIRQRIAAGDSKSEIKAQLVAQFGEGVLASPPKRGFDLLAWVLPLAGLAAGAAAVGAVAWRWSRGRAAGAAGAPVAAGAAATGRLDVDPELARRLDEELARFDG